MENLQKNQSNNTLKLVCAFGLPAIFLLVANSTPVIEIISQFSVVEKRIAAIFIMAALLWVLEPIPNFSTSLLVIVLELVLLSDKGLKIFRQGDVGQLLSYKDIIASFAAPIIILFLGGFTLALVAAKYKLDYTIAKIVLKPFGTRPIFVLLGLMVVTALFSMFMSNTATTAMMLSVLMPVLRSLPKGDKIKSAFVLGIPFAANIGGIGTPIGTPPNAIALRALSPDITISFSHWMGFAIPVVVGLLFICWVLLIISFPTKTKAIDLHLENTVKLENNNKKNSVAAGKSRKYSKLNLSEIKNDPTQNKTKTIIVYFTFFFTIVLWMTDFIHGMNSYVVALVPMLIFFVTNVCSKDDLKIFNWDVLWLVSGGVALGLGLEKTGLAHRITTLLNFSNTPLIFIILTSMIIMFVLSNFMSHTAASNLFLPILVAVAYSLPQASPSMITLLIVIVTFSSSLSMLLPISTPPNALGYGTGLIKTQHMLIHGLIIGLVGMIGSYYYFIFISSRGWL